MTDPKRLLDGGGTDLEQILLASGRAARPKITARWKTEALVFLAGLGLLGKAKAAAVPSSKAYAWAVTRYLAYGLGTAATAWGASHVLANRPSDAPAPVEVAHATRPIPPRLVESPPTEAKPPDVPPQITASYPNIARAPSVAQPDRPVGRTSRDVGVARPPVAAGAPSTAQPSSASVSESATGASVAGEIQELDRARSALAARDARAALGVLDRYDRAFPKGALQQEALRLRVEALVAAREREAARSLANRFRVLYPNSPHAKRLNSLVNEP